MFNRIVYLMKKHEYSLAQAYSLCRFFTSEGDGWDWRITRDSKIFKGQVKRLANVGRYRNRHPYSMQITMCDEHKEIGGVFARKLTKKSINNKRWLDHILNSAE